MYGLEHDVGPDDDRRVEARITARDVIVLVVPAVVMLAGFAAAVLWG